MNLKNFSSRFLPFFFEGIAAMFNFAALLDNVSLPDVKNSDAIGNDWKTIAKDYNFSMKKLDSEINDYRKKSKTK